MTRLSDASRAARAFIVAASVCAVVVACKKEEGAAGGAGGSTTATGAIKIGVYSPFTGGSSPMGLSMRDGARIAAEEINAAGGVIGRKVELVERDDQATNERGAQVMQALLSSEKVVAVLGPTNTGVAKASYPYPEQAKVPVLVNVSAGAPITELFTDLPEKYLFRIGARDHVQAEMNAREEIVKKGMKKVAILADDTKCGHNGGEKIEQALDKRSMKSGYTAKFKTKDSDMTPQLQEARAAG